MKAKIFKFRLLRSLIWIISWMISFTSHAQTCCSGGVPLANNIGGMPVNEGGTWQFSFTLDGNVLRTLKDETNQLEDDSRERITYSALFKTAYTFSDKFSAELLLTGVRQERAIRQGTRGDFTETIGLGDAVLLGYYRYLSNEKIDLTFGIGPKIPLGPSDLTNNNGITLNADLQPGSGAWDMILHHRLLMPLGFRPGTSWNTMATYRLTGENDDYLGVQTYEFGNEFQLLTGLSEQVNVGTALIGYGINFRYRHAAQDINNNEPLPNTGGEWVFLMPALSWHLNTNTTLMLNTEIPLYSRVTGTQLTPTYRANLGILWSPGKKEINVIGL